MGPNDLFLLFVSGHGKSDPFPKGILVTQLHIVEVIRRVVEHMQWKKFILMAHSMGCVIGNKQFIFIVLHFCF